MLFLKTVIANKIIFKNYLALTFLQAINAFFYIIIFPVVVPKIGIDNYGMFVYVSAILSFISILVNFGFDLPGLNRVTKSKDVAGLSKYTISVLIIKLVVFIVLSSLFLMAMYGFDFENKDLYLTCLIGVLGNVLILNWYYQGVQKVSVLAGIQAAFKVLSLGLILLLIRDHDDLLLFAFIINVMGFSAAVLSLWYVIADLKWFVSFPRIRCIKEAASEAIPFFWVSAIGLFKYRSIEVVIGSFFGVSEMAIYDLANKIYSIPSILSTSINTSIFPKVAKSKDAKQVKRIFVFEFWLAVTVVLCVIVFGSFAVDILGQGLLPEAYGILVLMSFNIFTFLIVGCYVYFVFVPNNKGDLVFRNQVIALISFVVFLLAFLIFKWSIYSVILALVFSGLVEIFYCKRVAIKFGL